MDMFKLPNVPRSKDLIDTAFRRGAKIAKLKRSSRRGQRDLRLKKSEILRVKSICEASRANLNAVVKHFPSYEQLPVFYQRLIDLRIDKNKYKKSLGDVQWAIRQIDRLENKTLYLLRTTKETSHVRHFLGRIASVIEQIGPSLDALIDIKMAIRDFPTFEVAPTLVIAGYPNVGKSTFLKNLTGADVKIAPYPFTTQDILIGYFKKKYTRYQIIDSPGILDRPMAERNAIELQSILAMQELADAILFILDPFQDVSAQVKLLDEVRSCFSIPIFVALNKKDKDKTGELGGICEALGIPAEFVISAMDKEDCVKIFELVFKNLEDEKVPD